MIKKNLFKTVKSLAVAGAVALGVALGLGTVYGGLVGEFRTAEDGRQYWYENGILQGLEGRGKEIYDPSSDAWYWLDSIQGGAVAKSKDIYQESWAGSYGDNGEYGKWVRYDANGHMVKGWDTNETGTYYFEPVTGAMAKGTVNIEGTDYRFDSVTGILLNNVFVWENGNQYWYEGGILQGTEGRGKEIYDPSSDAWYWLDSVDGGAVAKGKDVYQESYGGKYAQNDNGSSYGKWVRYDADGHMVKGWDTNENGTYYFEPVTGAMVKNTLFADGKVYSFDRITGTLITKTESDIDPDTIDDPTIEGPNGPMYDYTGENGYYAGQDVNQGAGVECPYTMFSVTTRNFFNGKNFEVKEGYYYVALSKDGWEATSPFKCYSYKLGHSNTTRGKIGTFSCGDVWFCAFND